MYSIEFRLCMYRTSGAHSWFFFKTMLAKAALHGLGLGALRIVFTLGVFFFLLGFFERLMCKYSFVDQPKTLYKQMVFKFMREIDCSA